MVAEELRRMAENKIAFTAGDKPIAVWLVEGSHQYFIAYAETIIRSAFCLFHIY